MTESPFFEEVFSMFEESFTGGFGLAGIKDQDGTGYSELLSNPI